MSKIAIFKPCALMTCLVVYSITATLHAAEPAELVGRLPKADWSAEQATGEPDTPGSGDIVTAWASATPDGQQEWLICEYAEFLRPQAVVIHETYNPGAVYKVSAINDDGEEVNVWKGKDPTPRDKPRGVSEIPLKVNFAIKKIKVYIDSPAVRGWNEIDAVGLRDGDGEIHWATHVEASSTFGENARNAAVVAAAPVPVDQQRLQQLEQELRELKEQMKELQKLRGEIKELKELLKQRLPEESSPARTDAPKP